MSVTHPSRPQSRRSVSRQSTTALLAAVAILALRIGAKAGQNEAQTQERYAAKVEAYNELMKQHRFGAALIVAADARRLQPDDPTSELMVAKATVVALAQMRRLDARLARKVASVDEICGLTAEQTQRLRLAGRGDIKRFCDPGGSTPISGLFGRRSMFAKVLRTTLTAEQIAACKAAAPVSPDGGVIRMVDSVAKKVWIGLGESGGVQPRMLYGVRMNPQAERDAPDPEDRLGDEEIKAIIEISRVLGPHLSEARILDEDVDVPITRGDSIIPQRQIRTPR